MKRLTLEHHYFEYVNEVLEFFLYSGRLFKPVVHESRAYKLITHHALARHYATKRVYGPDEKLWKDIRQDEFGRNMAKEYTGQADSNLRNDLNNSLESIFDLLEKQLGEYCIIAEDVAADCNECACHRYVNGVTDNFCERLFQCYKLGLWPCGWEGDFPNGRLIAFYPDVDVTLPGRTVCRKAPDFLVPPVRAAAMRAFSEQRRQGRLSHCVAIRYTGHELRTWAGTARVEHELDVRIGQERERNAAEGFTNGGLSLHGRLNCNVSDFDISPRPGICNFVFDISFTFKAIPLTGDAAIALETVVALFTGRFHDPTFETMDFRFV